MKKGGGNFRRDSERGVRTDKDPGPSRLRKIGFIGFLIVALCLITMGVGEIKAEESKQANQNGIVETLKGWDFSLGSYVYLFKAQSNFYGIGMSREIGKYLNLPEGWLDVNFGYLKGKSEEKEYGYCGLSFSAGRGIAEGIEWVGRQSGAEIKMPGFLKENMLKVGMLGASKLDPLFEDFDYGIRINILEIKFR